MEMLFIIVSGLSLLIWIFIEERKANERARQFMNLYRMQLRAISHVLFKATRDAVDSMNHLRDAFQYAAPPFKDIGEAMNSLKLSGCESEN